jgi:hypothetical protein
VLQPRRLAQPLVAGLAWQRGVLAVRVPQPEAEHPVGSGGGDLDPSTPARVGELRELHQGEGGDARLQRLGGNVHVDAEAAGGADLLQGEVPVEELQLLAQRDLLLAEGGEHPAESALSRASSRITVADAAHPG